MSSDPHSFEPYRSPALPEEPYAGPQLVGRTSGLTTLCVLCIVLGALGIANSGFGTIGLFAGRWFQQMVKAQPQAGMPADLKEAQEKMQDGLYAIQTKYTMYLVMNIIFRIPVGILLLLGGIRSLSLLERGRKLLLIACAVALLFDIMQAMLQSVIAMENMTVMHSFMESMAGNASGNDGIVKVFSAIIRFISIAIIYFFALAKIGLYVFGLIYLRKPQIVNLFHDKELAVVATVSDF
jgi:hypothetical protein